MAIIKHHLTALTCQLTRTVGLGILAIVALGSTHVKAQEQQWWFDIEVILFKRNIAPGELAEQFPAQFNKASNQVLADLLSDHIYPDLTPWYNILPACFSPEAAKPELEFQFEPLAYFNIDPVEFELDLLTEQTGEQESTLNAGPTDNDAVQISQRQFEDGQYFSEQHLALAVPTTTQTTIKIPDTLLCRYQGQPLKVPFVAEVPMLISSREFPLYRGSQILNSSSLEMQELARDIRRQRSLTGLLHMGWRQQVFFGQDNSVPLRIFAGQNFAKQFTQNGDPINQGDENLSSLAADQPQQAAETEGIDNQSPSQTAPTEIDLVDKIRRALVSEEPLESFIDTPVDFTVINDGQKELQSSEHNQLWELEGSVNVFLRYIQSTPYLHIDSQIDLRTPVFEKQTMQSEQGLIGASRLQSYPFNQLRRVISQQIHYFDHPMFGMIIQIRRHEFPDPQTLIED